MLKHRPCLSSQSYAIVQHIASQLSPLLCYLLSLCLHKPLYQTRTNTYSVFPLPSFCPYSCMFCVLLRFPTKKGIELDTVATAAFSIIYYNECSLVFYYYFTFLFLPRSSIQQFSLSTYLTVAPKQESKRELQLVENKRCATRCSQTHRLAYVVVVLARKQSYEIVEK